MTPSCTAHTTRRRIEDDYMVFEVIQADVLTGAELLQSEIGRRLTDE